MPNPYHHFLKLELNDEDLNQLKDAFYGKKPQKTDDSFLKLELNSEDLSELEDAFYGKKSQEMDPAEHLIKRKIDSIKKPEDESQPSLKKRKNFYFYEPDQYTQMQQNMFNLELDININQEDFEIKNKEEKQVFADQNMFLLNSKTGKVTQYPRRSGSKGPQPHKQMQQYMFELDVDIEANQKDVQTKNTEDKQISVDKNMFLWDSKTGNVIPPQHNNSKGPQHRYIFRLNSKTGKLTEPKEEQEQTSFSVNKP
ncbi:hypothetical protein [Legionella sp. WA2022007384]